MGFNRNDSPTPRKPASQFNVLEEPSLADLTLASDSSGSSQSIQGRGRKPNLDADEQLAMPLTTSRMENQQSPIAKRHTGSKGFAEQGIRLYQDDGDYSPVDKLLNHLNQNVNPAARTFTFTAIESESDTQDEASFDSSADVPVMGPPLRKVATEPPKNSESELLRVKLELEAARGEIVRKDQELAQQRITHHTIDQVLGSPSEANFAVDDTSDHLMNGMGSGLVPASYTANRVEHHFPAPSPIFTPIQPFPWMEDARAKAFPPMNSTFPQQPMNNSAWNPSPPWPTNDGRGGFGMDRRPSFISQSLKPFNMRPDGFETQSYVGSFMNHPTDQAFRRGSAGNVRPPSAGGPPFYNGYRPFSSGPSPGFSPPMTQLPFQQIGHMPQLSAPYQPRPIGTPLSPTALEFSAAAMVNNTNSQGNPWNAQASSETTSTYMAPMEPMNYRRLLDRNMSCNWKYIVDKIVCSNDQQASIFLQQKLKVATPEQKYELVEAIIAQAYPLMVNRFGNFLVQRCFEHGTPEQIIAIANAIRGNTLNLSMDAFGCHVVQKAFDVVPEDYKAMFVHELLRRIPETVIHRYACHVWQKLFELRWSDSPPQIMKYVNEALRGMWHEVALGETGSLVVQNIFENCLEEDKRPCINEVLASIDIVSHGQFGNWCIQHICEHGAPPDKSRAIEHVLRFATEYSIDQFASKVVEKCLKVAGSDFLDCYLERVCEARPDRPRMPLIDIAGDQYGNYLVQYVLIHANPQHRDVVASHIRKHMVSLRGSKFGSRVAMLCCNPASATRPGPPMGAQMGSRFPQSNMNTGMGYNRSGMMGGPYG